MNNIKYYLIIVSMSILIALSFISGWVSTGVTENSHEAHSAQPSPIPEFSQDERMVDWLTEVNQVVISECYEGYGVFISMLNADDHETTDTVSIVNKAYTSAMSACASGPRNALARTF